MKIFATLALSEDEIWAGRLGGMVEAYLAAAGKALPDVASEQARTRAHRNVQRHQRIGMLGPCCIRPSPSGRWPRRSVGRPTRGVYECGAGQLRALRQSLASTSRESD
jgi:hypothetical protein